MEPVYPVNQVPAELMNPSYVLYLSSPASIVVLCEGRHVEVIGEAVRATRVSTALRLVPGRAGRDEALRAATARGSRVALPIHAVAAIDVLAPVGRRDHVVGGPAIAA